MTIAFLYQVPICWPVCAVDQTHTTSPNLRYQHQIWSINIRFGAFYQKKLFYVTFKLLSSCTGERVGRGIKTDEPFIPKPPCWSNQATPLGVIGLDFRCGHLKRCKQLIEPKILWMFWGCITVVCRVILAPSLAFPFYLLFHWDCKRIP